MKQIDFDSIELSLSNQRKMDAIERAYELEGEIGMNRVLDAEPALLLRLVAEINPEAVRVAVRDAISRMGLMSLKFH